MRGIFKIILLAFLAIILWIAYLGYAAINLQPQISAEWGHIDEKSTELRLHVYLNKKLPISASIKELTVEWGGVEIGKAENVKLSFMNNKIDGALVIDNYKIIEAVKNHIKNGEKSEVRIKVVAAVFGVKLLEKEFSQPVNTDLLSKLTMQSESKGDLIKTPAVKSVTSRWGPITDNSLTIYSDIELYNPNDFPIPVSGIGYEVKINGYKLGEGELIENIVMPAKGSATAKVKSVIRLDLLPKVWVEHIKRGESSQVSVRVYLKATMFNRNFTFEIMSFEETIKTNIIDEINSALQMP